MNNNDDDNRLTGSFFNAVPGKPDDNDEDSNKNNSNNDKMNSNLPLGSDPFDFDKSMTELLQQRKGKPRAATSSTVGGVPTKGFGKSSVPRPASPKKPYVAIGPPDKTAASVNDLTKPEYDDQGYTLYQNEKTGEKSRVFEALVEYPCTFTMKIVGANEGTFVEEIVSLVAESCEVDQVPYTTKQMGKWTSVTVQAPVTSAEMLYALYENVDRDPRVKFKF